MSPRLWVAFKVVLSAVLVLLAALLISAYFSGAASLAMLGFAGIFTFMASVLWIDYRRPSRTLGLAGIVVAAGIGFLAVRVLDGSTTFPQACHGRGSLLCELQNVLYRFGGRPAASLPWLIVAVVVFYAALGAFKRGRAA
jgi:hypothetical protein